MYWMDIHAHLNMLETTPAESIALAEANGVKHIISIGTHPNDLDLVQSYAQEFFPKVSCTLGIHPHDAEHFNEELEQKIRNDARADYVVAIGECGLDYFYDNSPRELQKEVFRKQIQIALDLDLPLQIHTRDADEDCIQILREMAPVHKGVIHCFTGTKYLAEEALKLGLNISISGIITFKNAQALRDIVANIPVDRIHVETDSPFLAPVPMRGKKNTPAYVTHTAEFVAKMKNMDLVSFQKQMFENNIRVFSKLSRIHNA